MPIGSRGAVADLRYKGSSRVKFSYVSGSVLKLPVRGGCKSSQVDTNHLSSTGRRTIWFPYSSGKSGPKGFLKSEIRKRWARLISSSQFVAPAASRFVSTELVTIDSENDVTGRPVLAYIRPHGAEYFLRVYRAITLFHHEAASSSMMLVYIPKTHLPPFTCL